MYIVSVYFAMQVLNRFFWTISYDKKEVGNSDVYYRIYRNIFSECIY